MEKFSLFDFLAFVVPGGTLVLVVYFLFKQYIPPECLLNKLDLAILILPILFLSFILGHSISWVGTKIENIVGNKKMYFDLIQKSKSFHLYVKQYFPDFAHLITNEENKKQPEVKWQIKRAKRLIERVDDFLGLQDMNKVASSLLSQYAFFRNAVAVFVFLLPFFLLKSILMFHASCFEAGVFYIICFIVSILLSVASCLLMNHRNYVRIIVLLRNFEMYFLINSIKNNASHDTSKPKN